MTMTARDLAKVVRAGAKVRVAAADYSAAELAEIARASAESRGALEIRNAATLSVAECATIAEAAPGLVTFDL